MRVLGTLCVSAVALAMLATAGNAFAAMGKSTTYAIDGSDAAATACINKGGVVSTGAGGQRSCTTPAPSCAASTMNSGNWSSLDINDAGAVKACFDGCGEISANSAGQAVCTKPGAMMPDASSSSGSGREPSN